MLNEAVRKRLLMSHETFTAKRWEGKKLNFKFKYLAANYPELLFAAVSVFVVAPILCAYRWYTYKGSKYEGLKKYRAYYTVVRHDDPSVGRLLAQKEIGREFFPK